MASLTQHNCEALTKHSFPQILSLAGLLGIHKLDDFHNGIVTLKYDHDEPRFTIYIDESHKLKNFSVDIDFGRNTIRNNILVKKNDVVKDIAFKRLYNQITAANSLNFKYISLTAWCEPPKYTGYFIWCKYGFIMSTDEDNVKFSELMNTHGRTEKNLYELISAPKGIDFWIQHGFTWNGRFYLNPDSESMKIFRAAASKRNLAI